jgi:PIN domain nuclease of toxin-antitoxin system
VDLLLDTNALIWVLTDPSRLGTAARQAIASTENTAYVSVVNAWEMAIKSGLGKLSVPADIKTWLPLRLNESRMELLNITLDHVMDVEQLPHHHRDPFDRLIIAQARAERLTIVTGDPKFEDYDVPLIRC